MPPPVLPRRSLRFGTPRAEIVCCALLQPTITPEYAVENMGSSAGPTPWPKNCDSRSGSSYRRHPPPDLGRWLCIPTRCRAEHRLTECFSTRCLFERRPSRSHRDVVPMMSWSGLLLTSAKHAYEMGTSELHRTSIMLAAKALTTNRSMYPKDLRRRPRQKAKGTKKHQRHRYGGSIFLLKIA